MTYIGEGAFECCSELSHVSIPDSVKFIGKDAFMGYEGKKDIPNPKMTIDVVSGSCAEKYCKKKGIRYTCFGSMQIEKEKITILTKVHQIFDNYTGNAQSIKKILEILNNVSLVKNYYSIEDTDNMSPFFFEVLISNLFIKMGYEAYPTKKTGDQGVDIVARKGTVCIAIQTKCFSHSVVGNSAIQEVVAGMKYYNANQAYVVTNSTFTKAAIELARVNDVSIWDRNTLREMLKMYPVDIVS